jgi:DNA polymerase/3'-5' exonuclease PolX
VLAGVRPGRPPYSRAMPGTKSAPALPDSHIFAADLTEKIPRAEVARHVAFVSRNVPSAVVAGSYRRGAPESSDIDIIVREPIQDVLKKLIKAGYVYHAFAAGAKKFSGVVRLSGKGAKYRHLDLVFTTPRSYPFALLYFTGPARANIVMRVKAKRRGFKLNEYGLWRMTGPTPTLVEGLKTERDIYDALGSEYKEPKNR